MSWGRSWQGRSRARNCAQTVLIYNGMTAPPPAGPTSLEVNAEQMRQAPFEGVPNYWLPRVGLRQVGEWGGSLGLAMHGSNAQVRAGSGGQRDGPSPQGYARDLGRLSFRGQERPKGLERGQDRVTLRGSGRI